MTQVFFEEPIGRYRIRRNVWVGLCVAVLAFISGSILLGLALYVGLVGLGPVWKVNLETLVWITIIGIASAAIFVSVLLAEGLSVQRTMIADNLILAGKTPRLFKNVAPPTSIKVDDITRIELREGDEIPTFPVFRKIRLWTVRLTLVDGIQVEFRKYDPGFSLEEAWPAWKAFGEFLKRRGVEVIETRVASEVP